MKCVVFPEEQCKTNEKPEKRSKSNWWMFVYKNHCQLFSYTRLTSKLSQHYKCYSQPQTCMNIKSCSKSDFPQHYPPVSRSHDQTNGSVRLCCGILNHTLGPMSSLGATIMPLMSRHIPFHSTCAISSSVKSSSTFHPPPCLHPPRSLTHFSLVIAMATEESISYTQCYLLSVR